MHLWYGKIIQSAVITQKITIKIFHENNSYKIIVDVNKQTNWKTRKYEKQIFRDIFFVIAVGRCCYAERNYY